MRRSRPVAWLALGGLLATSLLICASATRSELLLPSTLRPLPTWLAGPLDGIGASLGLVALIVLFLVLFASYVVAARTAHRLSPRVLLGAILALHAMVLFGPPLFSSDVFSYTAYARIGSVYGANPYLHGPSAFPLEALHPLIGVQWVGTPTVYGPLFTALSYLLVPFGIAADVLAYKAVAAVSSLVLITLVWRAARLRGIDPKMAAALVGLNPVIVLFGVGGGHNDLLMLAIMVAGALRPAAASRALRRRPDGGGDGGEVDRRAPAPVRLRGRARARPGAAVPGAAFCSAPAWRRSRSSASPTPSSAAARCRWSRRFRGSREKAARTASPASRRPRSGSPVWSAPATSALSVVFVLVLCLAAPTGVDR